MSVYKRLLIIPIVASIPFASAEPPKGKAKVLDKFDTIDPKTVKLVDIKAKVIPTQDPEHRKVLEMIADFQKPGSYPLVQKSFQAGLLNPAKYSGIRFFAKTDNQTKMNLHVGGAPGQFGPEGRPLDVSAKIPLTDTWTQVVIPFADLKYYEVKQWKDGAQKIYPGNIPIADADLLQLSNIKFVFFIEGRGTDTTGRVFVDGLELVEK
ncbi:MAG: hypothetical protein WCO60_00715 [Verrucomicrobiota bacterium]